VSLPTTSPRASISAISTSKAPAELDRPAVGKKLAAMRQHPETSERDARGYFGGAFHRSHNSGPPRKFQIYPEKTSTVPRSIQSGAREFPGVAAYLQVDARGGSKFQCITTKAMDCNEQGC
jgi:hypothetical protein